jgi:DUF4097 and DUF4098 domain-containing protein YvlB
MKTVVRFAIAAMLMSGACLAGPDDISKINSSISIDSNQQAGDLSDVNGEIHVGDHCSVKDVSTVNGGISVGTDSKTGSLSTVNGELKVGSAARVSGNATTVNGTVDLSDGSSISGSLTNVNGHIHLAAAQVGDGITTVWGDIDIGKGARVEHGILVKKSNGFSSGKRPPTIIIAPGATVSGTLRFEHEVKLYVSDKANIGQVVGAQASVYSGDRP